MSETNQIILQWIKNHRNFQDNDAAHKLAKIGADRKTLGPKPIAVMQYSQLIT